MNNAFGKLTAENYKDFPGLAAGFYVELGLFAGECNYSEDAIDGRITSYNVCYTKLLRPSPMTLLMPNDSEEKIHSISIPAKA